MKNRTDISALPARLKNLPLFRGLPEAEIADILKRTHASVHTYAARSYLTEVHPFVMLVLSGRIGVYGFGLNSDDRHLIRMVGPGSELGLSTLFQEKLAVEVELVVKTNSTLLFLDTEALRRIWASAKSPVFTAHIAARLGEICQDLIQRVGVLSCYEISDRIRLRERHVAQASSRHPEPSGTTELAEYLCVGRTALYRSLEKMRARNMSHMRQR